MKYLVNRLGTEYKTVDTEKEAFDLVKDGSWHHSTKSQYMKFKKRATIPEVTKAAVRLFKYGISNRRLRKMKGSKRRTNNRKGSEGSKKLKQVISFPIVRKQGDSYVITQFSSRTIKHAV